MPKISVIVPAYDIELYIGKCIDSLVCQTLKDIEIIIVNDGSKDNTEQIIENKIMEYPNSKIILYNKENGGQSDARNFGIERANGEYIAFVDGDDYVDENMFLKMYNKTKEYPYDIIMCDVNCIYPNKEVEIKSGLKCDKKDMKLDDKKEMIYSSYAVVWNKIYKRELFNKDTLFMKGVCYEDVLFLYKIYAYVNSIGIIDEKLYNYVQRSNSITYTYTEKLYDILKILDELLKFYQEKVNDNYADILEYVYIRYSFGTFIKRLAKCGDRKIFNKRCG